MTKLVEEANLWEKGWLGRGGGQKRRTVRRVRKEDGKDKKGEREGKVEWYVYSSLFFRKKGMEMGSEGGEKKNQMKGEGWEVSWEQEERVRIKKEAG